MSVAPETKKPTESRSFSAHHNTAAAAEAQVHAAERVMKSMKQVIMFNQSLIEAYTLSAQTFFTGSQEILRQIAKANEAAFSEGLSNLRAFAASKSLKERLELEADIANRVASTTVAECSKISQACIDLTKKVSAPFHERSIAAAELMSNMAI